MEVIGLDHVQIAMPPGGEARASQFYGDLLGFKEIEKPKPLKDRGGCWFESGRAQIHLGVQADFVPASKAHPAFLVADLKKLQQRLGAAGYTVTPDATVPGRQRAHLFDPFGNRIELIQEGDGFGQRPSI